MKKGFALIGAGLFGQRHAQAYSRHHAVDFVAVCDIDAERARKAAERKGDVASNRRRRLAEAVRPGGVPAERVYPPLCPLLKWGRGVGKILRTATDVDPTQGAIVVDLGEDAGGTHAG